MSQSHTAERRMYPRTAALAGIRFYHPASRRELPGRTLDLSRGGLSMLVPAYAPLREGQCVQILELPPLEGEAEDADPGPRELEAPLEATVLRVDRASLPATGHIRLAVRFRRAIA